ncbi:hypothetical protein [Gracilibacillus timonensis]|uniref:hypothetical protein n=1 Tax=Gracilibacillus timonensis TaxID=1816696 RepID=UPI00082651EA|nr:hypothetical protein [Gracilibacillus timonensis]
MSRKTVKNSLIILLMFTPIIILMDIIGYLNNDSSLFSIENFSVVISIVAMIAVVIGFIFLKRYERKEKDDKNI